MKKQSLIALITLASLLYSCNAVESTYSYSKGTECLECGDYAKAITYFEEAVRLDPNRSRNHNNLAFAYAKTGKLDKAWFHTRQALLLDPDNEAAFTSFKAHLQRFSDTVNLKQPGESKAKILKTLGIPDMSLTSDTSKSTLIYGLLFLTFQGDTLHSTKLSHPSDQK